MGQPWCRLSRHDPATDLKEVWTMRVLPTNRRQFLQGLTAAGLAAFTTEGVFAQRLVETAALGEGPFTGQAPARHRQRSADRQRRDHAGRGRDHASHRPRADQAGQPMRNAFVEIWQVDNRAPTFTREDDSRSATTRISGLRPLPERR